MFRSPAAMPLIRGKHLRYHAVNKSYEIAGGCTIAIIAAE